MEQIQIGEVTAEETNEIQSYHLKRKALQELQLIVNQESDPLYGKLHEDLKNTIQSYNDWWNRMKVKYSWNVPDGKRLRIDFETGRIICVE